jgi:hypothetical protein
MMMVRGQVSANYGLRAGSNSPYTFILPASVLKYSLSELSAEQFKLCRVVKYEPDADDSACAIHCWLVKVHDSNTSSFKTTIKAKKLKLSCYAMQPLGGEEI